MTTKVHVHEPCRGPPDSRVIRLPEVHHKRHTIMQQIADSRSFLPQTGHIVELLAVNCPRCRYSELQRQPQSSTKKLTPSNIKGPTLDLARTTEGDQGKTRATSQVLTDPGTRALARICCPTKPGNNFPASDFVQQAPTSNLHRLVKHLNISQASNPWRTHWYKHRLISNTKGHCSKPILHSPTSTVG